MPTGSQPIGFGPTGADAPEEVLRRPVVKVDAKVFDPEVRAYVVDAYGQYVSQHPVDAWVQNQLFFVRGTMLSSPLTGNPGLAETHQGADFAARMTEAISRQLQPKVTNREIRVHSITVTPFGRQGGVAIETDYTNLVVQNDPRRRIVIR